MQREAVNQVRGSEEEADPELSYLKPGWVSRSWAEGNSWLKAARVPGNHKHFWFLGLIQIERFGSYLSQTSLLSWLVRLENDKVRKSRQAQLGLRLESLSQGSALCISAEIWVMHTVSALHSNRNPASSACVTQGPTRLSGKDSSSSEESKSAWVPIKKNGGFGSWHEGK